MVFDMSVVGHRIRVGRADARMSQDDLALSSGLSVDSIRKYESGSTCPTLENAYSMALALGVGIDELCDLPAPDERKAG